MKNKNRLEHIVSRKKIIMLDFDGVIKDSNGAKLEAFMKRQKPELESII